MMRTIDTPCHVMGDIHAKTDGVRAFLERHPEESLIILGDCGFGFVPDYGQVLDELAASYGADLYCLRGNHDDPAVFDNPPERKHLHILPDGSRLMINGLHCLAVGGGISIDRFCRKEDSNWWRGEAMTFNLGTAERDGLPVDLLLTHTGPAPPGIPRLSETYPALLRKDTTLLDDIRREQALCEAMRRKLKPRTWIYAHFHLSASWEDDTTRYRVLNVGESYDLALITR